MENNQIIRTLIQEFKVISIEEAAKKAEQWKKQYPSLNLPNEILKASRWEQENRTPQKRYKDKIKFLGNWFRKAGGSHSDTKKALSFWNERFEQNMGGIEYERTAKDLLILEEIVSKRGLVRTIILIEAFFVKKKLGEYLFFSTAARTIPAMKSSINEIIENPKIQKIYLNPSEVEKKLKLDGKT